MGCIIRPAVDSALTNSRFQRVAERLQGSGTTRALGASRGNSGTKATPKPLGVTEGWWPWVVGFVREGHSGTWERLKGDSPLGTRGTWEQARLEGGRRQRGCRRGDIQGHWPSRRLQSGKSFLFTQVTQSPAAARNYSREEPPNTKCHQHKSCSF